MIQAAIVGLGWWGRVLVEAVQGKSDAISIVAGATRTRSKAEDFAAEQGFRLLEAYEDVLADPAVQAVILATPHSVHREQIIAAAGAGKHVFVEKPITLTLADAEAAIDAVERAGTSLGIGFNRRFSPAFEELRRRLEDGQLGTLLHCEGTMTAPSGLTLSADAWRADAAETPVGGLTPMGVHVIDALIGLFGPVREVYCQSLHRAVAYEGDDTTAILLRLENGMSGYLGTMLATGVGFRFQVFGTGGWVEIRNPGLDHLEYVPNPSEPMSGQHRKVEPEVMRLDPVDTVRAELEAFAEAAEGGAAYPVSPRQILQGTATLEAIMESARTGAPVRAPQVWGRGAAAPRRGRAPPGRSPGQRSQAQHGALDKEMDPNVSSGRRPTS